MNKTRHILHFKQAVYELFGIGQDLGHLLSETLSPSGGECPVIERRPNWLHIMTDGVSSTAHSTARIIYAKFMPELRTVCTE